MPRKNLALEISLVVSVLLGAFIVQAVVSQTKPPKMPKFETSNQLEPTSIIVEGVTAAIGANDEPNEAVPAEYDAHQSALGHAPQWDDL
ncbi:MAG: hypothetical protein ABGY95_11090, partial [Rubritalea sp.]|uniref:hypothetical protein n=1 Tax=Rubritalea sp. TaxID=2109375 RepID=UPI0032426000